MFSIESDSIPISAGSIAQIELEEQERMESLDQLDLSDFEDAIDEDGQSDEPTDASCSSEGTEPVSIGQMEVGVISDNGTDSSASDIRDEIDSVEEEEDMSDILREEYEDRFL